MFGLNFKYNTQLVFHRSFVEDDAPNVTETAQQPD